MFHYSILIFQGLLSALLGTVVTFLFGTTLGLVHSRWRKLSRNCLPYPVMTESPSPMLVFRPLMAGSGVHQHFCLITASRQQRCRLIAATEWISYGVISW